MIKKAEMRPEDEDSPVSVSVKHKAWPDIEAALLRAANKTLDAIGIKDRPEVNIVLADDKFIRDLNKTYRGKDKATNVLSFPQDEDSMLGDIIMAYETVAAEAKEQGKTLEHHAVHLAVHGVLHLAGHDHETGPEDAEKMEQLEIKILKGLGIKNPYET